MADGFLRRIRLASLLLEGVAFPMMAKYSYANGAVEGAEARHDEFERGRGPRRETEIRPSPAPVESLVQNPVAGPPWRSPELGARAT